MNSLKSWEKTVYFRATICFFSPMSSFNDKDFIYDLVRLNPTMPLGAEKCNPNTQNLT